MDRHPLAGHFSVDDSARLVRHYRYVEERTMRIMGGWIALTPELPAKLLFGRHVWDDAQHADLWGRRLPELRAPAQQSEPANDGVVRFMDMLESTEHHGQTPERLAGIYRVLKPHLAAVYEAHLATANPVYEPPTRRILERCLDDQRRHAAAGRLVLGALTRDPARRQRAEDWERRLRAVLSEAGGVTGAAAVTEPAPIGHPDSERDIVALDGSFALPALPDDLSRELDRYREALMAGEREMAARAVAGDQREQALASLHGLPVVRECEVVGVAKIGAYRVIKLALTGTAGTVLVQQQWRRLEEGWRIVAADVVRTEPLG